MKFLVIIICISLFLSGCKDVSSLAQECKDKNGLYNYYIHQCFNKNSVIEVGKDN